MRLKTVEIDSQGILTIDIMKIPKSCVILFNDGKVKMAELPSHSETKIITHQGKVKRIRFDEGEEF